MPTLDSLARKLRSRRIAFVCFIGVVGIACQPSDTPPANGRSGAASVERFVAATKTAYEYEGTLGIVGVASSATAYSGEAVAARAQVTFNGTLSPGSLKTLDVLEVHYDRNAREVYRGRLTFEVRLGQYVLINESRISGDKSFQAFSTWPSPN